MNLLEKIETIVNQLLLKLGGLLFAAFAKLIPSPVKKIWGWISLKLSLAFVWIKNLPQYLKQTLPGLLGRTKNTLLGYNYKARLQETYKAALAQYAQSQPGAKISDARKAMLAPFLIMGQWLKGLSTAQTLVLLGFTAASVLSGINMVFQGKRLLDNQLDASRAPASVEAQVEYERPDYYKQQTRFLDITSIRLPIHLPELNALRSIDIDFTATLSNRMSRQQMEKLEFQLRDHLILNVEPIQAAFPLEDEGKEIIREKLTREINDFMKANDIEGEVKELKITYILAN